MITLFGAGVAVAFSLLRVSAAQEPTHNDTLPIVDVGHARHQAAYYDASSSSYLFSNIAYAAPPLGALRWAPPHPPPKNSTLQTGAFASTCPQSMALWRLPPQYNLTNLPPPMGSEDCLHLDIQVPSKVYLRRKTRKVPVLVWIHGGGFIASSKTTGTPYNGLIRASNGELIIAAFNYRLGAFGFLSGAAFREQGGVSNAGLHDQRFALEWLQKYVGRFGGDRQQITIMGVSAGGGSIVAQLTAYGNSGKSRPPFARAILGSPSLLPAVAQDALSNNFAQFLKLNDCADLACLRSKPSRDLQVSSARFVAPAPFGTYGWSPAIDGPFVPDLPSRMLGDGRASNVDAMVGWNAMEITSYADPKIVDFDAFIKTYYPLSSDATRTYISSTLYPATEFASAWARAGEMIIDGRIACHSAWLSNANRRKTWNYFFATPPATHGSDIDYTFWNGTNTNINRDTVRYMQGYVTNFALRGDPNGGEGLTGFNEGGGSVLKINGSAVEEMVNPKTVGKGEERCGWLQKGLWMQ